jgi:hypothetical protein
MYHFQSYQILKLQMFLSYRNYKCALHLPGTPSSLDYGVCAMQNAGLALCVCVCVCVRARVRARARYACIGPLTHFCLFNILAVYGKIFYYGPEILTKIYVFCLLPAVFFPV